MTASISWLASYPKSGNTWLRAVLASLLSGKAVDINAMSFVGRIASSRQAFDHAIGMASADLSETQITNLRPRAYEVWASEATRPLYCKVHDSYAPTPAGEPLFPASATAGVVYVVRDPRAVAVSFAHHAGDSVDSTIVRMNDPNATFSSPGARLQAQLPQRLNRWSAHAESWLAAPFPIHLLRYEDMIAKPHDAFAAVARFLDLPFTSESIEAAVEATTMARLQAQEREHGFRERSKNNAAFFREGKTDGWRRDLTRRQADAIVADHGDMMEKLGYDRTIHPLED